MSTHAAKTKSCALLISPAIYQRYYLAAELRRIGSSADDAIIDKYVAQHYDSFTRAMDRQQSQANEPISKPLATGSELLTQMPSSSTQLPFQQSQADEQSVAAFRSPPASGPSTAPYMLSNDGYTGQSVNPHLMELSSVHQPFTVSRLPSTALDKQIVPPASTESKGKYREESTADDMSEDEEEDSKDGLAELVSQSKLSPASSRSASHGLPSVEETPIAGSIMGPANELRPDPEAYRKLSSKEKRQLRNKISARNFRTRRKEHIAHLEQQVADRDTIIEGLRQQLALVKVQNTELTEEARVLKSKTISNTDVSRIIEALQKGAASTSTSTDMGPPSHLLRSSSNSSLTDTFNNGRPSTPASPRSNSPHPLLARPNMRKDLPSSGNVNSSKPFWGGVGGTGNTFMSVHTVLVPHLMNQDAPAQKFERRLSVTRAAAVDDSVNSLSKMLGEKLQVVGNEDKESGSLLSNDKKRSSGMREADVNEAIVSLLGEQDVAPPCYSEAIATPPTIAPSTSSSTSDVLDLNNEQLHSDVLAALNKAFTKSTPPASASSKASTSTFPQLDVTRMQALLDGRATLVLYDAQKGQLWQDESDGTHTSGYTGQAMPVSA